METTIFATAFILIGAGVLVRRFPILIAGYNTMTDEEKANVDIKGLSSFLCNGCVMMGIVPIMFYYTCLWIGHADWAGMAILFPPVCLPYIIFKSASFDHNKSHRHKIIVYISVIITIIIAVSIAYGLVPTHVKYDNGNITFTGEFGISKPISDFTSIRVSDTLPSISLRLNGMSVGGINKGKFKRSDGKSCHLYLSSSKPPYIVFTDHGGYEIYFNRSKEEETILTYQQLEPIFRR
jgi:uncharacterized membrane protein SirB2